MKKKKILLAAMLVPLGIAASIQAAEIQFLRNDRGKLIGTIVQDSSTVTVRDEKGYLLWQNGKVPEPQTTVKVNVETKEESCLLKDVLTLPAALVVMTLMVPLLLLK